ncbi:MAG TPA: succinate--CoA ligase subunit alpha [Candidatus Aminicenantes bacterium]|nr:succinate--CoA ligase subunit alpha [Candidatus Aminicenantes bacterium]HRY65539.1 succinate--CoA ligase subunit alpha [Candidatus Aminicenantes bacterium]HRZ72573.1 succinate--CoA ligase subunit alpha [Candidatus Aminicenantes bacterium]
MSILVDGSTRVVVQGLTGAEGTFHARRMIEYGTDVRAGVTPGKGGSRHLDRPVYDTVAEAVRREGVDASIIFVPARAAAGAILEAAAAGIGLIVCITEGIPALDMVRVKAALRDKSVRLVGPNTPGIISPGRTKLGIMPGAIHKPGPVGVVSRSGTLTYEAVQQLTRLGLGQSTALGIGGDPIIGLSFVDVLGSFQADPATEAVVLIGEIGGSAEEDAAALIRGGYGKPVVAYIAGLTAPAGRRMGHAGAIMSGGMGTAAHKIASLEAAGARVVRNPARIGEAVASVLSGRA